MAAQMKLLSLFAFVINVASATTCNEIGEVSFNVNDAGTLESDRMNISFPTSVPIGACIRGDIIDENLAMVSLELKCDPDADDGIVHDVYMGTECAGEPLPSLMVVFLYGWFIHYSVSDVQCGGEVCSYATVSSTPGCEGSSVGGIANLHFYFTGDICAHDDFKRECTDDVITEQPCNGGTSSIKTSGCNEDNTEIVKCMNGDPTTVASPTQNLECGGTYTGYLGAYEWKEWTFTTSTSDVVTFTNCHSDHDTTMYLANSAGINIQTQSTNYCWGDECYDHEYCEKPWGAETFTMDPLLPGTYTLLLEWWGHNTGNYEVSVFCESDDLDENGCNQRKCTSPTSLGNMTGSDCYAGTRWEGCTCDDGWTAVETGNAGPGSSGHANYEYTCCPTGGSTDGTCGDFARHPSDASCNQDWCSDYNENCWAGMSVGDPCTCHYSWEARETGASVHVLVDGEMNELFEFECCASGTPGARHDGTCGNHEIDVAECGGTYEGWLGPGEMKYWTFTSSTADVVTFTNCHSDHDTKMYLVDSSGWDITSQSTNWCGGDDCYDHRCSRSGSETFTLNLWPDTYTLKLMWYSDYTAGNYEVRVVCDSDRCASHDDCPDSGTFCYDNQCSSCDECHYCGDGVDGTCGSCGEGYPLYERPSDGTCSKYVPSESCHQLSCSNDNNTESCWSGYNFHGHIGKCTCDFGLEARETGRSTSLWVEDYSDWVEVFEYECCEKRTGRAHGDGTCGNYELDDDGCTQTKCTSPSTRTQYDDGGEDCWAGTESEGCTCADGWTAVETGNVDWDLEDWTPGLFGPTNGDVYYEYTCCPIGGTTDGACGGFVPSDGGLLFFVLLLIIIAPIIVCVVAIGICIYCCCCRNRNRERLASKAIPMNPAPPVAIAEGMDPPQMLQGQFVQQQAIQQMTGPVPQPAQQGVAQMVMGQNGQWVMQQPQWVQGVPVPQGMVQQGIPQQQQAPQQMQFVYQAQEGTDVNAQADSTVPEQQNEQPPIYSMQQFQYVP